MCLKFAHVGNRSGQAESFPAVQEAFVLSLNPSGSQWKSLRPGECRRSTRRECIGECLRAVPAHSERSAETIVIYH